MSGMSLALLRFAGDVGLTLSGEKKAAVLAEARRTQGGCVTVPATDAINIEEQLAVSSDAQLGRQ